MRESIITRALATEEKINNFLTAVSGQQRTAVHGLTEVGRRMVAFLVSQTEKTGLYIAETPLGAKKTWEDLTTLHPDEEILFFPPFEDIPFEVLARSREVEQQRLNVLLRLARGEQIKVVCSADALAKKLLPPSALSAALHRLVPGMQIELTELARLFIDYAYERRNNVENRGEFAIRGGICDFFPPLADTPLRLEFFDDEIDSIRSFDPDSQLSIANLDEAWLTPSREFFLPSGELHKGAERLHAEFADLRSRLTAKGKIEELNKISDRFALLSEQLEEQTDPDSLEHFQGYFYPEQCILPDYFPANALIIIEEKDRVRTAMEGRDRERDLAFTRLLADGAALPAQRDYFATAAEVFLALRARRVLSLTLLPQLGKEESFSFACRTLPSFMGNTELLAAELTRFKKEGYRTLISFQTREKGELFREEMAALGVEIQDSEVEIPSPGEIYLYTAENFIGIELADIKTVFISETDIFRRRQKRKPRRMFREDGERIAHLTDLKLGDYIVHTAHGIGRYLGVERLNTAGVERDYLLIKYRGEDRLYVPVEQVASLQKYSSGEGAEPRIHKLGSGEWQKTKARVTEAVKELAEDLIKLYALRSTAGGYAFSPDDNWQREFEDGFTFAETPDQLRSIEAVKQDMESPRPMDRLVCGDVGYGKTEIALRAAFKAANDGKQVAVLVPTTVLAEQHYRTFSERFKNFPIRLAALSRFRSTAEQKEIIEGLKTGQVDIVIGTHRLLNKEIGFKDLGLLLIDEEQRFGVKHKEKLKRMREHIDVLALSATPIPRTLHMSLVGLRDISIIETPPENRYPVQTYVVEHSPDLIREALRRELGRGGQVFYVHNRIKDIERTTLLLEESFPEARFAVAHGQMKERELESAMLAFLEREVDILVCTTIVENGLDIGNANTLIIDDADRLGLAQLYQLRGRVGRTERIAYAYLTYRKGKNLSETAEKRLHAIREFTELGSGFKIALRDLELRGAGNLLGANQHGHVNAVGYELYANLLEEAVLTLRGEKKKEVPETEIDLALSAHIPDDYIADQGTKLDFYQRLQKLISEDELLELVDELIDRFGELPQATTNLIELIRIKLIAGKLKIASIKERLGRLEILFASDPGLGGEELLQLAGASKVKLRYSSDRRFIIRAETDGFDEKELLIYLKELLGECCRLVRD